MIKFNDAPFLAGHSTQHDLFFPFQLSLQELMKNLQEILLTQPSESSNLEIDGGPGSGRYPKGSGEKGKKDRQKKSSKESKEEKQNESSREQKKALNNTENIGIIYAGKKVSSYIANPKTLGDTTHKEKYDDFKVHGVDVKPLGKGSHKGKAYEEGGGYRVNGTDDGQYMQYHPESKSHHKGEYYKLSSGKTGTKRYNMNGEPKED